MKANNKKDCIRTGDNIENIFYDMLKGWGFDVSFNNISNMENPDFKIALLIELKARMVPFRKSVSYVGLKPEHAIAINTNKIARYSDQTILLIYKNYGDEYLATNGIYVITAKKVRQLMNTYPDRKHKYINRFGNDGNARESYYVSCRDCFKLPDSLYNRIAGET